jgi:hypothetical protein
MQAKEQVQWRLGHRGMVHRQGAKLALRAGAVAEAELDD